MKKMRLFLALAGVVIALSGCFPKTSVVEQIAPAVLLYLDRGPGQEIKVATIVPPVKKEERDLIKTEGNSLLEAQAKLNANYFREIKSGQARLIFFSEKLATEGVADVVNTLYNDPAISARAFLAVVEGDMEGYIKENMEQFIDVLLYRQFKHYERNGEILMRNMHQYLRSYHSSYGDSFLPYFKVQNKKLVYSGLALFRRDKMIGTLSLKEERLFRILARGSQNVLELLPVEPAAITLTDVRAKTRIRHQSRDNVIFIKTQISGHLGEYQGPRDLSLQQNWSELKNEAEAEIQKELSGLIEKLQVNGVDPIHFGETMKTPFSEPISKDDWHRHWPETKVEVVVKLEIDDLGMMSYAKHSCYEQKLTLRQ